MPSTRDQSPLSQTSTKKHLRASRSEGDVYPPASLHHQYPQRSVSGWSYPQSEMRGAQPPSSYEHLPAPFSHSPHSISSEDLSYGHSSPHSGSWSAVLPSDFDLYPNDGMLNPPFAPSPYSDAYDIDPQGPYDGVGDSSMYNTFDVDFGSSIPVDQSHLHPVSQHKTRYISPLYVHGNPPSPPSSGSSSPVSGSFDYTEIPHAQPRDVSPASSSSSRSHNHQSLPPRTVSANDPKRRFPCLIPGCGRRFTSQYTLKVHTEAHRPKPRVSFPCTMGCSEKFSRQHDRLRHEVAKHNKICEHSCADCGRFFSNAKTFGNHKCPVAKAGTRWISS